MKIAIVPTIRNAIHSMKIRSVRWRSNLSEPSMCRLMRGTSSSLKLRLSMCCDFDRMDSSPHDRRLVIAFDDCDASASLATEKRVGLCPTRRKKAMLHQRGDPAYHVSALAGRARHIITCRSDFPFFAILVKKIIKKCI